VIVLEGRHTTFDVIDRLESGQTYTFGVAAVSGPEKNLWRRQSQSRFADQEQKLQPL